MPTPEEQARIEAQARLQKQPIQSAGSVIAPTTATGAGAAQTAATAPTNAGTKPALATSNAVGAVGDGIVSGVDAIVGGVGDAASLAGKGLDDFFSAETVNGPKGGSWGAAGTPAAASAAASNARGAGIQAGALSTGQQVAGAQGGISANLMGQANALGQRAAPVTNMAGADSYASKADSARSTSQGLLNQAGDSSTQERQLAALNNFANGPAGPSAAQAQLAAAGDNAQLSALSMARSGRGAGDSASALRDATFSNAQTQATTGQNMATLRAQEEATRRQQQLAALDSAMGGANAIRGADTAATNTALGVRGQDLQAQSQAAGQSQFNTTAQQNQTQINDAAAAAARNTALGFTSDANQTNLGFQGMGNQSALDFSQLGQNALNSQADYELQQQQMALDAAKANQAADLEKDSGITGMISAGVGALAALSDERSKKLKKTERALSESLGTLGNAPGYSYEYKDPEAPGAAHGRQVSSMAQDLERGPRGREIVHETPQGKMVDYTAVMKMTPGAITELNRKVKALESALGKGRAA